MLFTGLWVHGREEGVIHGVASVLATSIFKAGDEVPKGGRLIEVLDGRHVDV